VQANLEKSPWEATITGKVQTPDGSTQDAELRLQVVPGTNQTARVEFNKPASLEGNFVVIDDKEVWNYLFLTNQVIIQPRSKAKVEGLGVNLTSLGDFEELTNRLNLRPPLEVNSADGPAWRIVGTPKDSSLGFAQIELTVLKSDPRPVSIRILDSSNKVLAELNFRNFKRTNLTASALRKRPADAEVVRR
jgi:outer membrane lipoprotein-sorting protein